MVLHRSAEFDGLRFDSSWKLKKFFICSALFTIRKHLSLPVIFLEMEPNRWMKARLGNERVKELVDSVVFSKTKPILVLHLFQWYIYETITWVFIVCYHCVPCRICVVLESECSVFFSDKYGRHLWFKWQRKAGERKKFVSRGVSDSKKKGEGRGWGGDSWPVEHSLRVDR